MNEDFESYNLEDKEEDIAQEGGKRFTMWSLVPLVMVMPSAGWEKIKTSGPLPEIATIRFFLPLCLLSGLSVFFSLLYPGSLSNGTEENTFTILLVNGVIQFCSFFIGYYVALVLEKIFLPKDIKELPSTNFGKLLTMTGVSTLALFHIIFEALPMLDFILVFLPLWTIFLIYRGLHHTGMQSEKWLMAIGVTCIVIIAGPTLVEWLLALFA